MVDYVGNVVLVNVCVLVNLWCDLVSGLLNLMCCVSNCSGVLKLWVVMDIMLGYNGLFMIGIFSVVMCICSWWVCLVVGVS